MVQYAKIEERSASLSSEFGENLARRYFGDEAVDSMPKFSRGKRKGMLKGTMKWRKVAVGGWNRSINGVEKRVGKIISAAIGDYDNFGPFKVVASFGDAHEFKY